MQHRSVYSACTATHFSGFHSDHSWYTTKDGRFINATYKGEDTAPELMEHFASLRKKLIDEVKRIALGAPGYTIFSHQALVTAITNVQQTHAASVLEEIGFESTPPLTNKIHPEGYIRLHWAHIPKLIDTIKNLDLTPEEIEERDKKEAMLFNKRSEASKRGWARRRGEI